MSARVCICDDDPVVADLLGRELAGAGLQVQEPLSGLEQAMGWLSVDRPDLLILDLNMPAGGGLELLQWLQREELLGSMRVLMLTAEADDFFIASARRLGASGYLVKPVPAGRLAERVRRLLQDDGVAWVDDFTTLTRPDPAPPARAGETPSGLNPVVAGMEKSYGRDAVAGLLHALLLQFDRMDDPATAETPQPVAHAVRGAAASLGFERAAAACGELEDACRAGRPVRDALARARRACAADAAAVRADLAA